MGEISILRVETARKDTRSPSLKLAFTKFRVNAFKRNFLKNFHSGALLPPFPSIIRTDSDKVSSSWGQMRAVWLISSASVHIFPQDKGYISQSDSIFTLKGEESIHEAYPCDRLDTH